MKFKSSFALLCLLGAVVAQTWAVEPVRLVVAYPPGASMDHLARTFGDQWRTASGVTAIVENKAGANGTIAAQTVTQAPGDGNTILIAGDSIVTTNPFLYKKSKFDAGNLVPLGMLAFQSSVLVVKAGSDMRTLADFVARGRQKDIMYSSAGPGSSGHLVMAQTTKATGIKSVHVPYKGGAPAVMAVISGEVDAAFLAVGNVLPHIQQGKLQALAVSSPKRLELLPQVPTMAEMGHKDLVIQNGNMLMVSKGTPESVKASLVKTMANISKTKDYQSALLKLGMEPAFLTTKQTEAWLSEQKGVWGKVIQANGIEIE